MIRHEYIDDTVDIVLIYPLYNKKVSEYTEVV